MNKKLLTILALCTFVAVSDSLAQNRGEGRGQGQGRGGFGGPPGEGDRGPGGRGGFGGQDGGDRRGGPGGGGRPNMFSFLPVLIALDADKNGELSEKELNNATAALKKLDKNGDGKLTEDEIRPERPPGGRGGRGGFGDRGGDMRGGQGGFGGRGGEQGRGGFGGPGGDRGGRPDPAQMVERLMAFDKNGDGKLGKDELSERMASIIDRADTDKDGFASKEELTKMASQGGRGGAPGGDRRGGFGGPSGDRGSSSGTRRPTRPEFDN